MGETGFELAPSGLVAGAVATWSPLLFSGRALGIDLLVTGIALGALAASFRRGWLLPPLFACLLAAGATLSRAAPGVEAAPFAIAVIIIVVGVLLLGGFRPRMPLMAALTGIAGICEGIALGTGSVELGLSSAIGWWFGLAALQVALGEAAFFAVRRATVPWLGRLAGVCLVAIGLLSLAR